MRSSLASVPVLLLLAAVPAAAVHDWRAMRAEYQAEFATARMMGNLDDCTLKAYWMAQNRRMNQQIHAEYHAPLSRPASASGTAPAPAVPEVTPASFPSPARPR